MKFLSKLFRRKQSIFATTYTKDQDMKATIVPVTDGFQLYGPSGLVSTYKRQRDAKRGAERRGLIVA